MRLTRCFSRVWCGVIFALAGLSWGAVNIQGTVTDSSNGQAISGATVRLARLGHTATTGTDGKFQLTGAATGLITESVGFGGGFSMTIGVGNRLELRTERMERVRASVVTMQGKTVALLHDGLVDAGSQLTPPVLAPGYYLYLAQTRGERHSLGFLVDDAGNLSPTTGKSETRTAPLRKSGAAAAFADTVVVTKTGFIQKRVTVTDSVVSNLAVRMRASSAGAPAGMVLIPAKNKTYKMGAKTGEGYDDEYPQHDVTITYDFYMDETEVTQGAYKALMGGINPSSHKSDNNPVNNLTWFDAVLYCNRRSKAEGKDTVYSYTGGSSTPTNYTWSGGSGSSGPSTFQNTQLTGLQINYGKIGYRLPTEAEWEFAARGGNTDKYFFGGGNGATYPTGDLLAKVNTYAWHNSNSNNTIHPVKQKLPNPYGLYDINGNVWEWCNDWAINEGGAQGRYTSASAGTDPTGPTSGWFRNFRGGDWSYGSNACNSTFRSGKGTPSFKYIIPGFRTVLRVQ